MARNRVEVELDGQDNLTGKIRNAVLQAGLLESAMGAVMRVGGAALNAFQDASQAQLDNIKSAAGLQNVFEMGFAEAEGLNLEITQMLAKLAAPLPGTTDDYLKLFRQISDDVAIANKEINNGEIDLESYKEQIGEITSKWTILGQGMTVAQRNNALRGLLSGDSLKSLRKLEFFEANPQVMKALEDAQALSGQKLQDMTRGERLQVLLDALDVSMTDETLQRMTGSLDAQVQGFMSTLFDPTVGIFGMQRDLEESQDGVQSAFTAIAEAVTTVIGPDGLFFTIGDLLTSLGFEFEDPMVALQSAAFFFRDKVNSLTTFIRRLGSIFEASPDAASNYFSTQLEGFLQGFSLSDLGGRLSEMVNGIFQGAAKIDYGVVFGAIGKMLADSLDQGTNFLQGLDYGAILQTGLSVVSGLLKGIGSFLANLDFESYVAIATVVGAIGLSGLVGSFMLSMATAVFSSILMSTVSIFGAQFVATVVMATAGLPLILVAGAALAIAALAKAIIDNWDALWGGIKSSLDGIGNTLMGGFKILAGVFTGNLPLIKDGMQQFVSGIVDLMGWLSSRVDDVKANLGMETSGQKRANEVAMEAERRFQAANNRTIVNRTTTSPEAARETLNRASAPPGAVPNNARGYIPNASNGLNVGGLLAAAIREGRQMPSGAGLAIANTSEAILNQAQQRALANRLSTPSGGGLSINTLTVQTAATDAQGIANDIMQAIANAYRQHQQSKLTAIAT